MEDNVSGPQRSDDRFCICKQLLTIYWSLRHYMGPKSTQIWCYMVCFLSHIVSIRYERGIDAEPSTIPCFRVFSWVILPNLQNRPGKYSDTNQNLCQSVSNKIIHRSCFLHIWDISKPKYPNARSSNPGRPLNPSSKLLGITWR